MSKRYRDKQGRFISKKEYQRRKKISQSLKKRYQQKRKDKKRATHKSTNKGNNVKNRQKVSKASKKTLKKRSSKKTSKRKSKSYSVKKSRTKVKTFPKKSQPAVFFYSDKQQYMLKKPVYFQTPKDALKIASIIDDMKKDIIKFYKSKKRKGKLMNIGYIIDLIFSAPSVDIDLNTLSVSELTDLQATGKITVVSTKSFVSGGIKIDTKNIKSLTTGIGIVKNKIKKRFEEYLERQGFYSLALLGLEAEIEA